MTSAERTREYRRRRWATLEALIRRVVREELELAAVVDNRRRSVDNPVDKRHSRGRAPVEDSESGSVSSLPESVGDAAPGYQLVPVGLDGRTPHELTPEEYAELVHIPIRVRSTADAPGSTAGRAPR